MSDDTSEKRFGSLTASEAAKRSGEVRKRKAEERAAEQDILGLRQGWGVSLQKFYTPAQRERILERLGKERASVEVLAVARLMDQAFGRATEAEPDEPTDPTYQGLTREQRAVLRDALSKDWKVDDE